MKHRITSVVCAVLCMTMPLASCGNKDKTDLTPLMGLTWFSDKETVKEELSGLTFIAERENTDTAAVQYLLDYDDVQLLDQDCTLTVCCTEQGFVGLNYHDTARNNTYRQWYTALEDMYGSATEQGSGMASWYENPVGKNTAVYLFNLQEGVQISFYMTEANPDKSYTKEKGQANIEYSVPTPEIRTPVVPEEYDGTSAARALREGETGEDSSSYTVYTNAEGVLVTDVIVTDVKGEAVTDPSGETMTTAVPVVTTVVTNSDGKEVVTEVTDDRGKPLLGNAERLVITTTTTTVTTAAPVPVSTGADDNSQSQEDKTSSKDDNVPVTTDRTSDFLLNGLSFYGSPDTERRKMSSYTQLYEYRTEDPGQPWELIMEYENVRYLDKNCDGVLCFTSLGLVGVNYFDSNESDYSYWVGELSQIYGSPTDTQYDYTAWSSEPVGPGTMIYVFALEDGVQISFFSDDTGSEIS